MAHQSFLMCPLFYFLNFFFDVGRFLNFIEFVAICLCFIFSIFLVMSYVGS